MIGQPDSCRRVSLLVRGAVQGVGFRPFVFRLATAHNLSGWVQNNPQGVCIEVEGRSEHLESFVEQFKNDAALFGPFSMVESTWLDAAGHARFEIRESAQDGTRAVWIMPDLATCADCLRELFDPGNRRFRYPFLNCTQCGPRFSIVTCLPYDRPNTTMRRFRMCADCAREYADPSDRRFHAQPIACRQCGPHLELWDGAGQILADGETALIECARAIRQGAIVALKGLGGFHLLADARSEAAVRSLRLRKRREEKPFALMYPSLEAAGRAAELTPPEAKLLGARQAPIVLVRRRRPGALPPGEILAPSVAPGNPYLGMMLPYTPLHHLLMAEMNFPVVATSGNRADEPICINENEALARLGGIADLFLTNNRPIARSLDDSVVRVVLGREQILRRARGYAPFPITLDRALPPILAVGGHLKNTVAVSVGNDVFLSQHVGDLETVEAVSVFEQASRDLPRLYQTAPQVVACDLHPEYYSTRFAERQELPIARVQHHVAHVLSCMAENGIQAPVLGVAWDGTGFGTDGTIWGGEFFHLTEGGLVRAAHLRPFPLPGGELAIREPRRTALGLLHAWLGDEVFSRADLPLRSAFTPGEWELLAVALRRKVNSPMTTSVGRLFDAVAALAGVRMENRHEGQAAMEWEWRADGRRAAIPYPMTLDGHDPAVVDWGPLLQALLADLGAGLDRGLVSARFHAGLIEALVAVCRRVSERRVVLTGGCFLNRRLLEGAVQRLTDEGFTPYWHQRVPTGDGGIALGQIVAASMMETLHVPGNSR
ncbi:MAG: carbamoyltransferase HypF [Planctomycetes bacterium]|nr:carbamoyltransferase HypF [Planctomycetota bacterium]